MVLTSFGVALSPDLATLVLKDSPAQKFTGVETEVQQRFLFCFFVFSQLLDMELRIQISGSYS